MLPDVNFISSHPTNCVAVGWGLDDRDPIPTAPTHSTAGGGPGYHCSIYILNISYFPFII